MNPRARYDELAEDLAAREPSVELSQMMPMPWIKAGGIPHPRWLNQPPASSSR
jgi:hypothetical protein